jgi:hypothetical protein
MELGKYIMAPESISNEYFINASHQSLMLLGNGSAKSFTSATNIHGATEELLDVSFCMQSVWYQSKVGG